MPRSEITINLGAVRRNTRRLIEALDGSELWAVVKADAYGHGAGDVARVVLEEAAFDVKLDDAIFTQKNLRQSEAAR